MCSPTTYNTVLSPDLTMDWGVAAGAMCVRLSWTTAGTRAWMGLGFGTQMDGSTPVITVNPGTGASIDTYVNGPTGTQPTTTTSYTISMESATAGGSGGLSSTWLRADGFNPTGLNNMVWANGQTLASGHTPTTRGTICLDAPTGNVFAGNCPAVSTTGSPAGGTTGSPAGGTTGAPAGTTGSPAGTTGSPAGGTTGAPAGTTGSPAGTTGAPAGTTGAPAGTTGVPATTTGVASTTGVAGSTTGTTTGAAGNGTSTTGNSTAPSPPSSPAPSPSPPSSPAPTPASSTSDAPVGLATSATVAVTALTAAVALF